MKSVSWSQMVQENNCACTERIQCQIKATKEFSSQLSYKFEIISNSRFFNSIQCSLALSKAQNDVMIMKMQSERLSKEYDRLLREHSGLQVGDIHFMSLSF